MRRAYSIVGVVLLGLAFGCVSSALRDGSGKKGKPNRPEATPTGASVGGVPGPTTYEGADDQANANGAANPTTKPTTKPTGSPGAPAPTAPILLAGHYSKVQDSSGYCPQELEYKADASFYITYACGGYKTCPFTCVGNHCTGDTGCSWVSNETIDITSPTTYTYDSSYDGVQHYKHD